MHLLYDYHTHTTYSHGKGTIEDNVKAAIQKGLKGIAITDHGPGHLTYGIRRKKIEIMRSEIEQLKKQYTDIEIKLGVEANIIHTDGKLDVTQEEMNQFDIILAGYHYGVFGKQFMRSGAIHLSNYLTTRTGKVIRQLKKLNTEVIVKAINNHNIHILTHPGSKGYVDIREIAKACASNDTLMEINNSHRHLTVEEIKEASSENVKFIIDSDAHHAEKVGGYEAALKRAQDAGLELERIVNISTDDK